VKRSQKFNPPLLEMSGWMEVGNKLYLSLIWKVKFCSLKNGWLRIYKSDDMRADQCFAYISVGGNAIRLEEEKAGKIPFWKVSIVGQTGRQLFHRHGPDETSPPAPRNFFIFFQGSNHFRMRTRDKARAEKWFLVLKEVADKEKMDLCDSPQLTDASWKSVGDSDSFSFSEELVEAGEEGNQGEKNLGKIEEIELKEETCPQTPKIEECLHKPESNKEELVKAKEESKESKAEGLVGVGERKEEGERTSLIPLRHCTSSPALLSSQSPESTHRSESVLPQKKGETKKEEKEERCGLVALLQKAIGMDITAIALPISLNEPTTFLQRMCENLSNYRLLMEAESSASSLHRLTWVTLFCISMYSNNMRTTKPFNPLLGETFEFRDNHIQFFAEQVSHHPPVGACHASSKNFEFFQEHGIKTKFCGNHLLCEGTGRAHVILKENKDHYVWTCIKSQVNNIILTPMWIDHYGETEIVNLQTGEKSKIEVTKSGWFGKGKGEVKAWVLDQQGKTSVLITGKWNESLRVETLKGETFPATNPAWVLSNTEDSCNPFKLPRFAQQLNYLSEQNKESFLPSDSRFRSDRLALEQGDFKKAASEKKRLEERQREEKRKRDSLSLCWKPKYFERCNEFEGYWKIKEDFWEERRHLCSSPLNK